MAGYGPRVANRFTWPPRVGVAMQSGRRKLDGAESCSAFNGAAARLEFPCTGGSQLTVDWRRTWRALDARQAGSGHGHGAAKARWIGEQRGKHTRRGALGCSIHWRLSTHCGLEEDIAVAGGAAGWEKPFTHTSQTTGDWRAAWQTHKTRRVGSSHTLPTTKAAWFGGGWPGCVHPTLPLFTAYLN